MNISIVSIVISFVLQKILTHVNEVDQSGPVFCSCSFLTFAKIPLSSDSSDPR